jgi:hypothetical protein
MTLHPIRRLLSLAFCGAAAVGGAIACGEDRGSRSAGPEGRGTVRVLLTDAPFPFDSVRAVNVFVVRVDARRDVADSAAAASAVASAEAEQRGWITLARPERRIDLLRLRNGITTELGVSELPAGDYRSFRLIIDPARSDVELRSGLVLTGDSRPGVLFPSAAQTGIKVELDKAVRIESDGTVTVTIDFDVEESFVVRGARLTQNGLLFKPVLRGKVE